MCILILCAIGLAAADGRPAPNHEHGDSLHARFVPRPDIQTGQRGNLRLTSVLAEGAAPYPGTLFSIMREEPAAYGKTRRTLLASSGPQAQGSFDLSPGRYVVQARNGAVEIEREVVVPPQGVLRQSLVLDAGELHLQSTMDAAGEPADGTWFRVLRTDVDSYGRAARIQVAGNGYAQTASFLLPAGEYTAEATYGDALTEVPVRIDPAGVHNHTMVLNAGRLELSTTLVAGGEPIAGALIRIFRRQADRLDDGHWNEVTRAQHADAITFILPEGDYVAQASLGEAEVRTPVQVTAARTQALELPLNAGELILQTKLLGHDEPLLDAWFRIQAETLPEGAGLSSKPVRGSKGSARFILPAGRYLADARVGEGDGGAEVEVAAGTSQNLTIELQAGRVSLRMAADEQAPPYPNSWFSVYRTELDARGGELRRRVFNSGYYRETAIVLPAGRYIAMARNHRHRGERVFTLDAGEVTNLTIVAQDGAGQGTAQTAKPGG